MKFPCQIRINCTLVYLQNSYKEISSFINTQCVIYTIYKRLFSRLKVKWIFLCKHKYIYSKETLKHLMIFVVSEFIRKLQNKKNLIKEEMNVENDRNICVSWCLPLPLSTTFRSFDKNIKLKLRILTSN